MPLKIKRTKEMSSGRNEEEETVSVFVDDEGYEVFKDYRFTYDQTSNDGRWCLALDTNCTYLIDMVEVAIRPFVCNCTQGFSLSFQSDGKIRSRYKIPAEMRNDGMGVRFPWTPKKFYSFETFIDPADPHASPRDQVTKETIKQMKKSEILKDFVSRFQKAKSISAEDLWNALEPETTGFVFDHCTSLDGKSGQVTFAGPGFEKPVFINIKEW